MRAAVMRGRAIGIEELPDPVPGPGQILVAPRSTGICGSDLHLREVLGQMADLQPDQDPVAIVPGHELAGEVIGIGPDTDTDLSVGDLVTANPFTHGPLGTDTIGLSPVRSGGLAELCVVDAVRTIRLPDGVDARLGALVEPVAVAVHAFSLGASRGPVVVVGAGPIGLGVVAVAALAGREPILVVEPSASRREMATRLGAHRAVEPGPTVVELLAGVGFTPSTISPLLDDDPASVTVYECAGRPDVVASVIAGAPAHSTVVLGGACTQPVEVSPLQLTLGEVSVTASYAYRPRDFRAAVGLITVHPERIAAFVTSERPLGETEMAFDALATDPAELKIQIRPQASGALL